MIFRFNMCKPDQGCGVLYSMLAVCFLELTAMGGPIQAETGPVRYQQDWLAYRSETFQPAGETLSLRYRGDSGAHAEHGPDFDDPRSVLEYVLSNAPASPVVYPSELYYYYEFALGERIVSGNLRFTEADDGVLNIGYFDRLDQSAMRWAGFSAKDGVVVRMSDDGMSAAVTCGETRREFALYQGAFGNEDDIELEAGERYVSGILDESGYFLHLIYSEDNSAFYYVLQSNRTIPEPLIVLDRIRERLPGDIEILLGVDSRFVFLRDSSMGRTVLIAVNVDQTAANTYYDGPFDQVPPRLPLRPMLEAAYPYVASGKGIDAHGRFLGRVGQRVAISPYLDYRTFDEVEDWLEQTIDIESIGIGRWIGVVLESKRFFHHRLEQLAGQEQDLAVYSHEEHSSGAWPAGHWVPGSRHKEGQVEQE